MFSKHKNEKSTMVTTEDDNPFNLLSDELILTIFQEVAVERERYHRDPSMNESYHAIATLSAVDRRFNSIANDKSIQFTLVPAGFRNEAIRGNLQDTKKTALFEKLVVAICYDELDKVKLLLSLKLANAGSIYPESVACECAGYQGTLLHSAAYRGAYLTATYLLEQGASLDALNGYGETPLARAKGQLEKRLRIVEKKRYYDEYSESLISKLKMTIELFEKQELLHKEKFCTDVKDTYASIATSASAFFASRLDVVASEDNASASIKNNIKRL